MKLRQIHGPSLNTKAHFMANAIQKLRKQTYEKFFHTSGYAPKNEIDFEVSPDGDITSPNYESEIRIAVEKK